MKTQPKTVQVVTRKIGNHSSGEARSRNGRMGRGVNAFEGKLTVDWQKTLKRIDVIAGRQRAWGEISVSYPLHVRCVTLRGVKL